MSLRNRLYDRNLLRTRRLAHPVISVGNLSVGGSGKTPLVQYLARLLSQKGWEVAILSRGYRGSAESGNRLVSDGSRVLCGPAEAGDEPFLMARELPGAIVAVGRERWRSAGLVEERHPSDRRIFLMDDGFQHRKLARDLDIVVIDATSPPFSDEILPAGRLREPVTSLGRAGAVLITRSHLAAGSQDQLAKQVRSIQPGTPVFFFGNRYAGYRRLSDGYLAEAGDLVRTKVIALAALGNPRQFIEDLGRAGVRVINEFLFRDHHPYTQSEIDLILSRAAQLGAEAVVTTEKDAVRLEGLDLGRIPFWAFRVEPEPLDEQGFRAWFEARLLRLSGAAGEAEGKSS